MGQMAIQASPLMESLLSLWVKAIFLRALSFLNQKKAKGLVAQSRLTLRPHGMYPARLLCPWNSPGKNTGVGCHSLLQGISPTQGSNLGLLHCRPIIYHLSHKRSSKESQALCKTYIKTLCLGP